MAMTTCNREAHSIILHKVMEFRCGCGAAKVPQVLDMRIYRFRNSKKIRRANTQVEDH
jgi:hypothetical protein